MTGLNRVLTPVGWVAVAAVLTVLLVAFAGFDPLGLRARKMEQLRRQAEAGAQEQRARHLEASENARLETLQAEGALRRSDLAQNTGKLAGEAGDDPTGQITLGDARLERLRQHDRLVCEGAGYGACQPAGGAAR
ncbi:hypothetical protein OB03_12580 [Brevundimonas sp. GN22]|uniref:hypothetical protein n=1 Tax=Brevundimonas pishanensis TaxID=2896315 RepID=UPI001FA7F54B|nr:hypothetical protein [Brevundimonas pishanensis]